MAQLTKEEKAKKVFLKKYLIHNKIIAEHQQLIHDIGATCAYKACPYKPGLEINLKNESLPGYNKFTIESVNTVVDKIGTDYDIKFKFYGTFTPDGSIEDKKEFKGYLILPTDGTEQRSIPEKEKETINP